MYIASTFARNHVYVKVTLAIFSQQWISDGICRLSHWSDKVNIDSAPRLASQVIDRLSARSYPRLSFSAFCSTLERSFRNTKETTFEVLSACFELPTSSTVVQLDAEDPIDTSLPPDLYFHWRFVSLEPELLTDSDFRSEVTDEVERGSEKRSSTAQVLSIREDDCQARTFRTKGQEKSSYATR